MTCVTACDWPLLSKQSVSKTTYTQSYTRVHVGMRSRLAVEVSVSWGGSKRRRGSFKSYRAVKTILQDHPHMRAVMRVHFRSRDKDGGHTIRSAVPENPILHANTAALFDGPGVIADRSFTLRDRNFRPFWLLYVTLTLTRRPSYANSIRRPWRYTALQIWTSYVKDFESYRLTDIQTDRQPYIHYIHTDRQTRPKAYTTPLRGWSLTSNTTFWSIHSN